MANYCSNYVTFTGPNSAKALSHFASLGNHSFPFLDIYVSGDYVLFESRWMPPIKKLNQLAEELSFSYKLDFDAHPEGKGSYSYTCLQEETLDSDADMIRKIINKVETKEQFEKADKILRELLIERENDPRELGLFASLMNHKATQLNLTATYHQNIQEKTEQKPWESDVPSADTKRSR